MFGSKRLLTTIDAQTLKGFKTLQDVDFEHSGHIDISNGKIKEVFFKKSQWIPNRDDRYELSFHTHPPNYERLYPDHPSFVDMKYIVRNVASGDLIALHLIFTPRLIYSIGVNAILKQRYLTNPNTIDDEIDVIFHESDAAFNGNRSAAGFRSLWIARLRTLGFVVHIHTSYTHAMRVYAA